MPTGKRLLGFLAATIIVASVSHFAWSAILAGIMSSAYRHRLPDITRIDGKYRFELIGRFMAHEKSRATRPLVGFMGSSFTYGHPWQESVVFSYRYAEMNPHVDVINLSLKSADTTTVNDWMVCYAKATGVRFKVLYVEIPVVNEIDQLSSYRRAGHPNFKIGSLDQCTVGKVDGSYFDYFLRHPFGIGWLILLWDTEAYPKPERSEPFGPVPKGYFATREEFAAVEVDYMPRIRGMLQNAQEVADTVVAYPSPILLSAVRDNGGDIEGLRMQLGRALDACREVPGVRCVEPSFLYEDQPQYYNLTHLNQRGNQTMAEWLSGMSRR